MNYEEMKAKKEKLEKELAEINKAINEHEGMVYKGKLNKAIALLEECCCYYGEYEIIGKMTDHDPYVSIDVEFGDVIEMLKEFME